MSLTFLFRSFADNYPPRAHNRNRKKVGAVKIQQPNYKLMKNIALATLIANLSGMCPVRTPEELPTADSSPKCNNASSTPAMRYLIESHGKDGK
jgi:hypothetical protein